MNLKETIRRVLNEGLKETIINYLKDFGVLNAITFFGGWKIIEDTLGDENITSKMKINFIKELTKKEGGISVFDLNEDPIPYDYDDNEYQELYFFGPNRVSVKVWEREEYEEIDEFSVIYEILDDHIIDKIFYMLLEHYVTKKK